MGSELFENRSGTCESCHYVDDEGDFKRWDYEKYDLYKGITDVSADEANLEVSYDQDTITETDDIFFKSIKQYGDFDPAENWRTDDSYMDPALYENWMFTVGGEVENPLEMTLPELVEKFGTKTVTMKQQCCINGVGNATIFQRGDRRVHQGHHRLREAEGQRERSRDADRRSVPERRYTLQHPHRRRER